LKAGAKDFIGKPFDLEEMLLRVHSLLEIRLLHEAARRPAVRPASDRHAVPRVIGWILATLVGLWLVYRLWKIVLIVVVALVIAGTFNPLVRAMESRGLKRRNALILLMVSLVLGAALLIFLTVPPLINQLTTIVNDLPAERERLIGVLGAHRITAPVGRALGNVGLEQAFGRLQTYVVGYWPEALKMLGYGVTALSLSFYVLADRKRTQGALYAVVPRAYHMRLARIVFNLETIVGGYMRGQLLTSAALGIFTFLLLAACGVQNAVALALLAAMLDVIPIVGGLLATVAVVLTALVRGVDTAGVVLVGMWLYLQFESKVLVPRVYGHVLRLSPAAVILALLAGGTLLGVLGALLALPVAAALRMIFAELGVGMPGDDSQNPVARAQDEKTEAAYGLMSAGSTAPDAGQIANELAQGVRDADAWVAASLARKKIAGAGGEK